MTSATRPIKKRRPKAPLVDRSRLVMTSATADVERTEGLGHRHDLDAVDVDVGRLLADPEYGIGAGLTHQCLYFEQPHTFEQILFIQTAEPALVGHA